MLYPYLSVFKLYLLNVFNSIIIIADTEGLGLDINDPQWDDVNLFAGCLKMYFQELPEPLFTYQMYTQFVDVISKFFTSSIMSQA